MKKIIIGGMLLMVIMTGCSSKTEKTEAEIRAEVIAEIEAEEQLKEELKAEIEAEIKAEAEMQIQTEAKDEMQVETEAETKEEVIIETELLILTGILRSFDPPYGNSIILSEPIELEGYEIDTLYYSGDIEKYVDRSKFYNDPDFGWILSDDSNVEVTIEVEKGNIAVGNTDYLLASIEDYSVITVDGNSDLVDRSNDTYVEENKMEVSSTRILIDLTLNIFELQEMYEPVDSTTVDYFDEMDGIDLTTTTLSYDGLTVFNTVPKSYYGELEYMNIDSLVFENNNYVFDNNVLIGMTLAEGYAYLESKFEHTQSIHDDNPIDTMYDISGTIYAVTLNDYRFESPQDLSETIESIKIFKSESINGV